MRSYIVLALAAAASAADFTPPAGLTFIPGTDKVATTPSDCLKNPNFTPCPAKLDSGNIIVPAFHQVIDESQPDKDATASSNGVNLGFTVPDAKELRTLAIIPDFPKSGEGKQCQFHFISDQGSNLASTSVPKIAVWSLKPGKIANLETTFNTRPERNVKVAAFDLQANPKKLGTSTPKLDHTGVDGAAFPLTKTFDCPKPGTHIAWELAIDVDKQQFLATKDIKTLDRLFVGGMNGLGVEIVGVKQTAYGTNGTSTTTPSGSASSTIPKPSVQTGISSQVPQDTSAAGALSAPGLGLAGMAMAVIYSLL